MNETKSFRIKSSIGEEATCWHISPFRLMINWDSGVQESWVPQDLEEMFAHHGWQKLEEELHSFKYYHIDEGPEYVNTWHEDGTTALYDGKEIDWWGKEEEAEDFIKRGWWIVLPSEPENKPIETLQLKIEIDNLKEVQDALGEMKEKSNTTLEAIKEFTTGTDHSVFITEGIYKVYRKDEDMPYVCATDEELVRVMNALMVLDEAESDH